MHLKVLQKESFKKQEKQLAICLVITLLIKSQKFQKIQKQLQMRIIKKYVRAISPEKRQKIIDDLRLKQQYNTGIPKKINLLENTPNQPSKFTTKIELK